MAVLRQYGRAKGVTEGALNVLAFMALQTLDSDLEPTYFGGRRRIAAGCKGADVDLLDPDSTLSKTDANRVSQCLGALVAAGAITQVRAGAARKVGRRDRDSATSAAYRINISEGARQWVVAQLRRVETRPEIPGTSADNAPGNPGRVSRRDARESRAGVPETRPEIPGTQRRSAEEVGAEEARTRHREPSVPRPPAEESAAPAAFCAQHATNPTDAPCRRCGEARQARAVWLSERAVAEQEWRTALETWRKWAGRQPMCEDDVPGGNLVRTDVGYPTLCAKCRKRAAARGVPEQAKSDNPKGN